MNNKEIDKFHVRLTEQDKRILDLEVKIGKVEQLFKNLAEKGNLLPCLWVNKKSMELEGKQIPDECPECKMPYSFKLFQLDGNLISISIIRCPECKWYKDITAYELI